MNYCAEEMKVRKLLELAASMHVHLTNFAQFFIRLTLFSTDFEHFVDNQRLIISRISFFL